MFRLPDNISSTGQQLSAGQHLVFRTTSRLLDNISFTGQHLVYRVFPIYVYWYLLDKFRSKNELKDSGQNKKLEGLRSTKKARRTQRKHKAQRTQVHKKKGSKDSGPQKRFEGLGSKQKVRRTQVQTKGSKDSGQTTDLRSIQTSSWHDFVLLVSDQIKDICIGGPYTVLWYHLKITTHWG